MNRQLFPYLSECTDWTILQRELPEEALSDMEEQLRDYLENPKTPQECESHGDVACWYEGIISTDDLLKSWRENGCFICY